MQPRLSIKNRIYVGVCGTGGQYNADGGHHFDVLKESASGLSLAYKVSIPGYPQAAPILSTAYENQDFDGDGKADGRVYLYFTYNAISRRNLHADGYTGTDIRKSRRTVPSGK